MQEPACGIFLKQSGQYAITIRLPPGSCKLAGFYSCLCTPCPWRRHPSQGHTHQCAFMPRKRMKGYSEQQSEKSLKGFIPQQVFRILHTAMEVTESYKLALWGQLIGSFSFKMRPFHAASMCVCIFILGQSRKNIWYVMSHFFCSDSALEDS